MMRTGFSCSEPVSALPTPPTAGGGFADGAAYAISGLDESIKVNDGIPELDVQ